MLAVALPGSAYGPLTQNPPLVAAALLGFYPVGRWPGGVAGGAKGSVFPPQYFIVCDSHGMLHNVHSCVNTSPAKSKFLDRTSSWSA